MDAATIIESEPVKDVFRSLFGASNSNSLEETLQILIESSRTEIGRSDLASKAILPDVLNFIQSLSYPLDRQYLTLALKLLRNLCAGEIANQNFFTDCNGVESISVDLKTAKIGTDPDYEIIRLELQILANVSLAGEKHQRAIWHHLFQDEFTKLALVRRKETLDPLCKLMYICFDGCPEIADELCKGQGLDIMAEILRTASVVGFEEDWLKLLISRICVEEAHFRLLFYKLSDTSEKCKNSNDVDESTFLAEQAFLLRITSEIVNERVREITVPKDLVLCVLEIFKRSIGYVDFVSRCKSSLPTASSEIDCMGYSLTIMRDACAVESREASNNVVNWLLSSGLLELVLSLLNELEPPEIISKGMKQNENIEGTSSFSYKKCPYKGFRRDIVAVIGNCAYKRKHVQDEIRKRDGILVMLQQCVTDENNPFLREWGIWSARNLLEGNEENQQVVTDLEIKGTVDVPQLAALGLKVEVDQKTQRPKLVNVP